MTQINNRRGIASLIMITALVISFMLGSLGLQHGIGQASPGTRPLTYQELVKRIAAHHKAPFQGNVQQSSQVAKTNSQKISQPPHAPSKHQSNVKVNQDLNPWAKVDVAAAINPLNGQDYLVMSTDARENYSHSFYHISTTGGRSWSDDALPPGIDQATNSQYVIQTDPGVAFDSNGHSFLSSISSNTISTPDGSYANYDNEIDLVQGYNNGTYTYTSATPVDYAPCNGQTNGNGVFYCPGQLTKPAITIDNGAKSPNKNSIYVYYTYFCSGVPQLATDTPTTTSDTPTPAGSKKAQNSGGGPYEPDGPCIQDGLTIAPNTSVILAAQSSGAGLPFSTPKLVSGVFSQAEFGSMVIDSHGTPHIFFDDFTSYPTVHIYESTLQNGNWTTNIQPLTTLLYNQSPSYWYFGSYTSVAPSCTGYKDLAYCTVSASQIGNLPLVATPDIYLLKINTITNSAAEPVQINNDPNNGTKYHFNPWPAVSSKGFVYVGWYDSRHDPLNTRLEYFVGKSIDGGKTFSKQQAISDQPFNPCANNFGCTWFGDYDQLAIGPDDIVHAIWSDTRDGVGIQLYTQAIKW
ncbi:hypothetical protein [Tengunoibacter tsumagoiensis]|uniref:Exo-alpha-sialidase n=1 Tax=Tengunoibacter tsumagoiensis TaxID=2014871 RepID=A0A401ZZA8_9CHLR|nr:hypothetical protein [Tengunoibacter tsumagoiensis]GCE12194.1 hypothetical protein KTT_20530 [Tengunoibacter tsumagoiensis]